MQLKKGQHQPNTTLCVCINKIQLFSEV